MLFINNNLLLCICCCYIITVVHIELCTAEGSLRLAGGTGVNEGRVEICGNGLWNFVCGTFWGPVDAQVVCRQLGYSTDGTRTLNSGCLA